MPETYVTNIALSTTKAERDAVRLGKFVDNKVGRPRQLKLDTSSFSKLGRQPLGKITGDLNEFEKSLNASNARVLAFGASAGVLFGMQRAFKALLVDMYEVNKALTDIQAILGGTNATIKQFGSEVFRVASQTGQAFDVAAKAAGEFARQGLTLSQTLEATRAALILQRISGLDAVSSVESLTAAVNSFNREGLSHIDIVDRIVSVDTAFAVSAKDLADGLKRVGSTAIDANVSFNELIAGISATQQISARGGAVIANGFKTIFTRLQRSSVGDTLAKIGVQTRDMNGDFKGAFPILKEMAESFKTLSSAQRAQISESVAGVFQINTLKTVLKDLGSEQSQYAKALKTAEGAAGNAQGRIELLNKSYADQIVQVQNAFKELSAGVGEDIFGDAVSQGANLLESLAKSLQGSKGDAEKVGFDLGEAIFGGILGAAKGIVNGPLAPAIFITIGKLVGKTLVDLGAAAKTIANLGKNTGNAQGQAAALSKAWGDTEQRVSGATQKTKQVSAEQNRITTAIQQTVLLDRQRISNLEQVLNLTRQISALPRGTILGPDGVPLPRTPEPPQKKKKAPGRQAPTRAPLVSPFVGEQGAGGPNGGLGFGASFGVAAAGGILGSQIEGPSGDLISNLSSAAGTFGVIAASGGPLMLGLGVAVGGIQAFNAFVSAATVSFEDLSEEVEKSREEFAKTLGTVDASIEASFAFERLSASVDASAQDITAAAQKLRQSIADIDDDELRKSLTELSLAPQSAETTEKRSEIRTKFNEEGERELALKEASVALLKVADQNSNFGASFFDRLISLGDNEKLRGIRDLKGEERSIGAEDISKIARGIASKADPTTFSVVGDPSEEKIKKVNENLAKLAKAIKTGETELALADFGFDEELLNSFSQMQTTFGRASDAVSEMAGRIILNNAEIAEAARFQAKIAKQMRQISEDFAGSTEIFAAQRRGENRDKSSSRLREINSLSNSLSLLGEDRKDDAFLLEQKKINNKFLDGFGSLENSMMSEISKIASQEGLSEDSRESVRAQVEAIQSGTVSVSTALSNIRGELEVLGEGDKTKEAVDRLGIKNKEGMDNLLAEYRAASQIEKDNFEFSKEQARRNAQTNRSNGADKPLSEVSRIGSDLQKALNDFSRGGLSRSFDKLPKLGFTRSSRDSFKSGRDRNNKEEEARFSSSQNLIRSVEALNSIGRAPTEAETGPLLKDLTNAFETIFNKADKVFARGAAETALGGAAEAGRGFDITRLIKGSSEQILKDIDLGKFSSAISKVDSLISRSGGFSDSKSALEGLKEVLKSAIENRDGKTVDKDGVPTKVGGVGEAATIAARKLLPQNHLEAISKSNIDISSSNQEILDTIRNNGVGFADTKTGDKDFNDKLKDLNQKVLSANKILSSAKSTLADTSINLRDAEGRLSTRKAALSKVETETVRGALGTSSLKGVGVLKNAKFSPSGASAQQDNAIIEMVRSGLESGFSRPEIKKAIQGDERFSIREDNSEKLDKFLDNVINAFKNVTPNGETTLRAETTDINDIKRLKEEKPRQEKEFARLKLEAARAEKERDSFAKQSPDVSFDNVKSVVNEMGDVAREMAGLGPSLEKSFQAIKASFPEAVKDLQIAIALESSQAFGGLGPLSDPVVQRELKERIVEVVKTLIDDGTLTSRINGVNKK